MCRRLPPVSAVSAAGRACCRLRWPDVGPVSGCPVVRHATAQDIAASNQAYYETQQREAEIAKAQKEHPRGLAMIGAGTGLLVLGGVSLGVGLGTLGIAGAGAIVAASLGGVGLTVGMILLIIGIVLAVRAKKTKAKYGVP